ncbi:MAG: hypothetical protein LBE81_07060 [Azonexus sp.]|jgi:hypothetical protein|uniref:hypothetical protein n=1 Tax=Azonexus sp. TaxID=1872668 RepID=UPI00283344A2|nr:hypothetical protein [Azonexus sp.]MDR0776381.1 hypothetical protein [Azonexus sp.]
MPRTLNLAIGLIVLPLLIIALYGGLGALMGFGYFGENLVRDYPWIESIWKPLWLLWVLGWFPGIVMSMIRFRSLIHRVAARQYEKWFFPDALLALGHASILLGIISMVFPYDFFYFCLMWAGFFYAVGVGLFAVFHSK